MECHTIVESIVVIGVADTMSYDNIFVCYGSQYVAYARLTKILDCL